MPQDPNQGAERRQTILPLEAGDPGDFRLLAYEAETRRQQLRHLALTRQALATYLLILVGFVVVAAWVSAWLGIDDLTIDHIERLVAATLGSVTGLAGAAIGFYFASRRDDDT